MRYIGSPNKFRGKSFEEFEEFKQSFNRYIEYYKLEGKEAWGEITAHLEERTFDFYETLSQTKKK